MEGGMEGRKESSTHLNLRWEDHKHTFVHLLDDFRLQKLYCDASLACVGGVVYPVHKVVLSACSDFFASIFASASYQNPVVVLQDVSDEELEALLTYVYRGQVLLPRHALSGFLKVAGSLQVKGLSPPPLTPLPGDTCDTWGSSNEGSPPPDASIPSTLPHYPPLHPALHPSHPPPPYPHPDRLPPSPESCAESWGEEVGSRSSDPLPQTGRGRETSQRAEESQRPLRKRFSPHFGGSEQFGGTFRNLVTSEEEEGIKEEPQEEEMDLYNADRLTIYEKEEHEEGDEEEENEEKEREEKEGQDEEGGVKEEETLMDKQILEEGMKEEEYEESEMRKEEGRRERKQADLYLPATPTTITVNGSTTSPSPSLPSLSPIQSHPTLSPTPGHPALPPIPATPQTIPSQLRRELLKPLQNRPLGPPHPQQAIPHPVIATRDGEGMGVGVPREPPPLVKIASSPPATTPPLHSTIPHQYAHPFHSLQARQPNDGRENTINNTTTTTTTTVTSPTKAHHHHHHHHLLVTTQPTYRPRLGPPPQPHAPHTPAAYPTVITPFKVTNLMDSDTPLNLSQDHYPQQLPPQTPIARVEQVVVGEERRARDSRDPFLGKIMTNRKRRLRGPKSWEYLVRLLRDPTTNPTLIRWENEGKGVFRLVQPAVIAQRWGRRTGKHASECLSYENFARGLRYHYATGALQPVSERSFVYKFGPKALLALGDDREYTTSGAASPTAMLPLTSTTTTTTTYL